METAESVLENYKRVRQVFWATKPPAVVIRKVEVKPKLVAPAPERAVPLKTPPPPEHLARVDKKLKKAACALASPHRVILSEIARKYDVPVDVIRSRSRLANHILLRHIAFWKIYHALNMSLPQIGNIFGKDPKTVLYGVVRINTIVEKFGEKALNDLDFALECSRAIGHIKRGGGGKPYKP